MSGGLSFALALLCGVLAGLIGIRVARAVPEGPKTGRKALQLVSTAVAFALLFGVARFYVVPPLQARWDASRVDDTLSASPAFAALRKHDPATYEQMMNQLREGLLAGRSRAELIESLRTQVTVQVQKRLPRASDDAAIGYMRVMVQEMQELRQHGGDLCYRFLYAGQGQGLNLATYVSANTLQADQDALSQVVRTSVVSPQPVPTQAEVALRLEPVITALAGRHGQDLALLQQPQAPGVDREKLCAITIDMYSVILQMPAADSGKLIRYLMGQG